MRPFRLPSFCLQISLKRIDSEDQVLILRRRKVKATAWNRKFCMRKVKTATHLYKTQRRRKNKPQKLNNQLIVSLEFVIPFRNFVRFFSHFTKIQSSSNLLCAQFLSKCFCFASYSGLLIFFLFILLLLPLLLHWLLLLVPLLLLTLLLLFKMIWGRERKMNSFWRYAKQSATLWIST